MHDLKLKKSPSDVVVALVGCPNVGKSTLFNLLTGKNQHVGNWSGKTVSVASGHYDYKGKTYILVDLPGTYSLHSQSPEEQVAVDFIQSGQADCVIAVVDGTRLERTLIPAIQVMELEERIAMCVNMMDEAERLNNQIDLRMLGCQIGIPIIGVSARDGSGADGFREMVRNLCDGFLPVHPKKLSHISQRVGAVQSDNVTDIYLRYAEEIASRSVKENRSYQISKIDQIVLGKVTGPICMIVMLLCVLWLTIKAANYPSVVLETVFMKLESFLRNFVVNWPWWLSGILFDGIYETTTCVISVMLPPVAVFFVLFSLLEEFGFLPRAAFLMDRCFETCGSCGKQALTLAMGFGCNSVGVMGTRIISSPQSRLIAIITNAFVPCNGRFPAMILLVSAFLGSKSLICTLVIAALLALSVGATMLTTKVLSSTILNTQETQFILELPSYKRPGLRNILSQMLIRRIGSVLIRAIIVSVPTGMLLWLGQYVEVGNVPALIYFSRKVEFLGKCIGMNGVILTAFLISFPANELLIPSIMLLLTNNSVGSATNIALRELLISNGWTINTVICTLVFLIFHWPCSTTCLTIHKETGSWKWTLVSICLPTMIGILLCSLIARI